MVAVLVCTSSVAGALREFAQPRCQVPLEQLEEPFLIVAGSVEHQVVQPRVDILA